MSRLSIRFKITCWFSAALALMILLTYFIVLSVSYQVIQKTIKDNLIETVERNFDEVEFYLDISGIDLAHDADQFMRYADGYLEIDDDFLEEVNQVYTALYLTDGTFLYGENPIAMETADMEFTDAQLRGLSVNGVTYYLLDRQLTGTGLGGLWLRGVVSEEQGAFQTSSIAKISLIILPMLGALAIAGGSLIAGRMLKPIQEIARTANRVRENNDLKMRIHLGNGNDELHQLAHSFNDMFARLDKAFEAERQFVSDASHELRTPMSVISAQCEYALERTRSTEEYIDALHVIQRQGNRMSKLIENMLEFARLEAGGERYALETVDLSGLIASLCADMALIREKNIKLQWDCEAGIVFQGNRELLSRLFSNLISNAYRYGQDNGHIWVRLGRDGGNILLSVSDDGIGIAGEDQEKIFRRFYQTDASRSREGMGLGLSMAYEIAKFHKGDIRVDSEIGKGSIFTVILPE